MRGTIINLFGVVRHLQAVRTPGLQGMATVPMRLYPEPGSETIPCRHYCLLPMDVDGSGYCGLQLNG